VLRITLASLATVAVATEAVPSGQMAGAPASTLAARIQQTLGAAPANCGQFFVTSMLQPSASAGDLRSAVSCIIEHRAKKAPAWVLIQLRGIDSWVAYGLFVGADGRVRRYSYDSDPSGGSGAWSRFTERACEAPRVISDDQPEPAIRCE
jgi:hypothetical protein